MAQRYQPGPGSCPRRNPIRFAGSPAALALAAILAGTTSSCRVGNHVSNSPAQPTDPFSGFYETAPQSLKFCAEFSTTQCATVSTSQIPSTLTSTVTDPVALIVKDVPSGTAFLTSPSGSNSGLPINVASPLPGTLSYLGGTSPQTLWNDPACQDQIELQESGTIQDGGPFTTGSNLPLLGRLILDIQVVEKFTGTCGPTLQLMYNCYLNVAQCGGSTDAQNQSLQTSVQGIVGPYIQNNVMTAANILTLQSVSYEVGYQ